jgi:hypothetical protein
MYGLMNWPHPIRLIPNTTSRRRDPDTGRTLPPVSGETTTIEGNFQAEPRRDGSTEQQEKTGMGIVHTGQAHLYTSAQLASKDTIEVDFAGGVTRTYKVMGNTGREYGVVATLTGQTARRRYLLELAEGS